MKVSIKSEEVWFKRTLCGVGIKNTCHGKYKYIHVFNYNYF